LGRIEAELGAVVAQDLDPRYLQQLFLLTEQ
jgi:hypothetical protein